jgi:hypothetical protein
LSSRTDEIAFIRPCSPLRATTPPVGEAWLHEPKLDGPCLHLVRLTDHWHEVAATEHARRADAKNPAK